MAEQSRELDGTQSNIHPSHIGVDYAEEGKDFSALTVKIDVDVSEAITGLKAVQREAKKAAQAIRELETYYGEDGKNFYVKWRQQGEDCTDIREVCMTDIPTCYLQRELEKREGVTTYKLGSYGTYANMRMVSADGGDSVLIEGPAIITVNID